MKINDEWINDLPSQFQSRKNIEVLINAFSRQLEELKKAFKDLNMKTDIDVAVGKNLDMAGSIVSMSRVEAASFAGVDVNTPLASDDIYRRILTYKKLRNTNDCTYYDIIEGLKLLWGTSSPIYYQEKPERPATIFLTMPKQDIDATHTNFLKTLNIKPGGVSLIYESVYDDLFYLMFLEIFKVNKLKLGITVPIAQRSDTNGKTHIFIEKETKLAIRSKISLGQSSSCIGEITIDKNPWTLNGEVLLDGSRKLDSKIWKEIL